MAGTNGSSMLARRALSTAFMLAVFVVVQFRGTAALGVSFQQRLQSLREGRLGASAKAGSSPEILVDGAFSHAPFDGRAYGFRTRPQRYVIPDRDGRNGGQQTWVDIATCCAAAPKNSKLPRDDANGEAFAPAPAQRCLSFEELQGDASRKPLTYKDDVAPRGSDKSPCYEQNPAFYKDITNNVYGERHGACCSWFKSFLQAAWHEYPDRASAKIINKLNEDSSASLYEKAAQLVRVFDAWRASTCHSADGMPSDLCCIDCMSPRGNKLARYSGTRMQNGCSFFGDGWCAPHSTTSVEEKQQEQRRIAEALQRNPSIFVDGAFNHRPVHGKVEKGEPGHTYTSKVSTVTTSLTPHPSGSIAASQTAQEIETSVKVPTVAEAVPYITRSGGPEIAIPDHDGHATGQATWIEIARCCAATPQRSDSPNDSPNPEAFASPPAERCADVTQLRVLKFEFGTERGPCRRENPGYYHDLDESYKPRYTACCAYMKGFLKGAALEFPDPASQTIISTVRGAGDGSGASIMSQSLALLNQFNRWNRDVCTDSGGAPTGRCCRDCVQPHVNKLRRFEGLNALRSCSADGEGWCKRGQRIPVQVLKQLKSDEEHHAVPSQVDGPVARSTSKAEAHAAVIGNKGVVKASTKTHSEAQRLKELETLHHLESDNNRLLAEAEKLSPVLSVSKAAPVLDHAKMTLLDERIGLRQVEDAVAGNHPRRDTLDKLAHFASVNGQLPSLLQQLRDFSAKAQQPAEQQQLGEE